MEIKDLFSDLSKILNEAADYTVKETGKLTGIAKVKYNLSGAKNKLNLLYQGIGKLKCCEQAGEEADPELYEGFYAQVAETKAEIAILEREYARLLNRKICDGCGATIGFDMQFCPRCGAKQPESAPDAGCDCGCCEDDKTESSESSESAESGDSAESDDSTESSESK